jgi:hypothetical protein
MAADTVAHFSATIQDETGLKANTLVHLFIDSTQTIAQAVTALDAWITALTAITDGKIISNRISIVPTVSVSQAGKPVSGSEVQETASFDFPQSGTAYHWASVVPSFNESLETTDHKPDLSNADVTAYYTLLGTGTVLGGHYTGPGNDTLGPLAYAFLPTRKHRRGQNARSLANP